MPGLTGVGMTMSVIPRASRSRLNATIAGPRIRLRRRRSTDRRLDAALELRRVEKRPSGDVLDVGPVEQPAVASGIARSLPAPSQPRHEQLRRRPEARPSRDSSSSASLERDERLERRPGSPTSERAPRARARDCRATTRAAISAGSSGQVRPDGVPPALAARATAHDLERRDGGDRDQEERQQEPDRGRA